MKRLILTLLLAGLAHFGWALQASQQATLAEHLLEVNSEWANYLDAPRYFNESVSFADEDQRIRRHLLEVCKLLENGSRGYSQDHQQRRSVLIDQLRTYAEDMSFPVNSGHSTRRPYFIDKEGTACAVGQLMLNNGFESEALLVQKEINTAYIREIPKDWLKSWMDFSSFTLDELALIQPGYPPNTSWASLGETIEDGSVNVLLPYDNVLLLGGSFNVNGSLQRLCMWDGEQLVEWPSQPTGEIRDLILLNDKLYACGSFNGMQQDVALWENDAWTYQNAAMGKTAEAYTFTLHDDKLYLASSMSGFAGFDHYVYELQGDIWQQVGYFDEAVHCLYSTDEGLIAAGDFTNLMTINGPVEMNHIARLQNGIWENFGQGVGLPIRTVNECYGALVSAGMMFDSEGISVQKVLKRENDVWVELIENSSFSDPMDVGVFKGIECSYSGSDGCYFGGNFKVDDLMTFGDDLFKLASVEIGEETIYYPDILLFGTLGGIKSMVEWNGALYIAGDFMYEFDAMNLFAWTDLGTGLMENEVSFKLYPNPTSDQLFIEMADQEGVELIKLFDQAGREFQVVLEGKNPIEVNTSGLTAGNYILMLYDQSGTYLGMQRFIKQ